SESPHIAGILKDGKQLRQRAFRAAAQYLSHFAADRGEPVAVLLEDLHWADEGSLDFIEELAGACASLPIVVLCTTRPTLFERRASWGQAVAAYRRIDIEPQPLQHSREMADALLRRIVDPPAALRDLL